MCIRDRVKGEFGTYSGPIEVVVANKDGKELFRVKQDVSKLSLIHISEPTRPY